MGALRFAIRLEAMRHAIGLWYSDKVSSIEEKPDIRRRHIRFQPKEITYAEVDMGLHESFEPKVKGHVFSEAYGGCGLVVPNIQNLQPGDQCRVKVGNLPIMQARVAWRQQVDDHVIKLGIEYLE